MSSFSINFSPRFSEKELWDLWTNLPLPRLSQQVEMNIIYILIFKICFSHLFFLFNHKIIHIMSISSAMPRPLSSSPPCPFVSLFVLWFYLELFVLWFPCSPSWMVVCTMILSLILRPLSFLGSGSTSLKPWLWRE